MDVLIIVVLTLINAIFAMSEMALTASRRARLNAMEESGDKGAAAALRLMENPTRFLSTVQVGITSIGLLNGIVGEAAFSDSVQAWFESWGLSQNMASWSATAIVVTVITYTTIVFGELVPKRIGQMYPELVARLIGVPMTWVARAANPFVQFLSASTQTVLRLLRIKMDAQRGVTEEEITASLEEGVDAGLIEEHERQMVQNVFHLDDRPLASLMVPRSDIVWLDAGFSVAESLGRVAQDGEEDGHSWYPVCRGSLDDVVGVISVARLLQLGVAHEGTIDALVTAAVFVPETLNGMELLEQFRLRASRIVFVVDEYGVVQGLLTPADLLEAITGELKPSAHDEAWAVQRADGTWLLEGLMPVAELRARLDIRELPGEDRGLYNTVAGLLMAVSGRLPNTGESITTAGWRFEVVDMDGRRIDKVLATQLPSESDEDG
jgi:putative hemolysin